MSTFKGIMDPGTFQPKGAKRIQKKLLEHPQRDRPVSMSADLSPQRLAKLPENWDSQHEEEWWQASTWEQSSETWLRSGGFPKQNAYVWGRLIKKKSKAFLAEVLRSQSSEGHLRCFPLGPGLPRPLRENAEDPAESSESNIRKLIETWSCSENGLTSTLHSVSWVKFNSPPANKSSSVFLRPLATGEFFAKGCPPRLEDARRDDRVETTNCEGGGSLSLYARK